MHLRKNTKANINQINLSVYCVSKLLNRLLFLRDKTNSFHNLARR